MHKTFRMAGWIIFSGIIIGLDQFTKQLALKYLTFQQPTMVIQHFFNLYLDFNKGAAFNFLSKQPGWQMWFFGSIALIVSVGIVVYLFKNPDNPVLTKLGLSFILGGALGNFIDRIRYQHVVDFISWHYHQYYWPTFNIADSAVCVGVVLLFLTFKREHKP